MVKPHGVADIADGGAIAKGTAAEMLTSLESGFVHITTVIPIHSVFSLKFPVSRVHRFVWPEDLAVTVR